MTGSLRLIGLTGGIGSGKSTVARMIAARGIPVIDADQLAREVVDEPDSPALAEIAAVWPAVIDAVGRLDRRRLGRLVFGDAAARARLEAIMHPRIVKRAHERAAELARAGHRVAFYEASLLVETRRYRDLDGLVVVDAPLDVRVARVVTRDRVTDADARARIAAQLPSEERRRVASQIIENDGDAPSLEAKVEAMLRALAVPVAGLR